MSGTVTDSRFYMWRAVFAMAHADHVVTDDERAFMRNALETERFSEDQRRVLLSDMDHPQNVAEMFMNIAEQEDRSRFFYYARMMCWSDGDFAAQEQDIVLRLSKVHVRNVDFDELVATVDLELADDDRRDLEEGMRSGTSPLANFLKRLQKKG